MPESPRFVSRSTAAFILKVADTEERLAAVGVQPAGVLEHESGTERPLYLKADVTAARIRINADEIAALGGEVVQ